MSTNTIGRLPSHFQIDDPVRLAFGDAGGVINCRVIKVHFSDSKVFYDVDVEMHFAGEEEKFYTRLYNVDSAFVEELLPD